MNRQRLLAWLLALLPLALLVSSIGAVVASFAAWGAAAHVDIPDWETTAVGLVFAVPGVAIGALVLRQVIARTRDRFSLTSFQLVAGVIAMLIAVGVEAGLGLRIASPGTYDGLRNTDGTLNTTASGFLFIGVGAAFLLNMAVALGAYIYAEALSAEARTHFDRRPDEPDAVGEMLHGRHGPGTSAR